MSLLGFMAEEKYKRGARGPLMKFRGMAPEKYYRQNPETRKGKGKKKLRQGKTSRSTILTSPLGTSTETKTKRKTLLGA